MFWGIEAQVLPYEARFRSVSDAAVLRLLKYAI